MFYRILPYINNLIQLSRINMALKTFQKYTSDENQLDDRAIDMSRVATIILGGGQGKRLFPLTQTRCKPAISFGGRYRLIDIPLSNSINSGCLKIFIITQFLSTSLNHYIFKTYQRGSYSSGFIELLSVEERPTKTDWFQGPADAVRQNIDYFIETPADYFLILSGDQLYNMNFQQMLKLAKKTNADMVIAALPVEEATAKRMGLLKINSEYRVTEFCEKPQEQALLEKMKLSTNQLSYLGSMGIYLFKREALFKLLEKDEREDFGKHLIPTLIQQGNVVAHLHQGYWEDIGTIESFYKANLALTQENPMFDLYDESNPIFHSHDNMPASKLIQTHVNHSIICEGSYVEASEIENSIIGPRLVLKKGSRISSSYLMGNDFYKPLIHTGRLPDLFQIGEECVIHNAIIDKHVYIGKEVKLINKNQLAHYNSDDVYIRDGIIIVTRGASLPDG